MLNQLDSIKKIRKLVDNNQGKFNDVILNGYSDRVISSILQNLEQSSKFIVDLDMEELNSILRSLYITQEYTGLTRDYLVYNIDRKSLLERRL